MNKLISACFLFIAVSVSLLPAENVAAVKERDAQQVLTRLAKFDPPLPNPATGQPANR